MEADLVHLKYISFKLFSRILPCSTMRDCETQFIGQAVTILPNLPDKHKSFQGTFGSSLTHSKLISTFNHSLPNSANLPFWPRTVGYTKCTSHVISYSTISNRIGYIQLFFSILRPQSIEYSPTKNLGEMLYQNLDRHAYIEI